MLASDLLVGVLIGLILTLTGAGGSIVASPLLVFFAGVTINDATGLTLAAVCISAGCMSAYGYWRGRFSLRPVLALALAGMAAAPLGRVVVEHLDSRVMGILFSMMALAFSMHYLFGKHLGWLYQRIWPSAQDPASAPTRAALLGWGGVAGGLSGFFGIGGGIVLMPITMRLLRLPVSRAIYHCMPAICLITATGSLTFISYAEAELLEHLLVLALGALTGSAIGLALLPRMNPSVNLRILGLTVLVSALGTLYHSLF